MSEEMMAAPSMTLTITGDDAQRMLAAGKALKTSLRVLQKKRTETATEEEKLDVSHDAEDGDAPVPKRVVSASDNESVASDDEADSKAAAFRPLHEHLVEAVESCDDGLLRAFVAELTREGFAHKEISTCLLLFLDADKKAKMSSAFLSLSESPTLQGSGAENSTDETAAADSSIEAGHKDEKPSPHPSLTREGTLTFFRCLLSSICLCIKEKSRAPLQPQQVKVTVDAAESDKPSKVGKESDNSSPSAAFVKKEKDESDMEKDPEKAESQPVVPSKSPSFEAMMEAPSTEVRRLTDSTMAEILEIATFASNHLYKHIHGSKSGKMINLQSLDDWYRIGGFSVVPWLELLEVQKWSNVGRGTVSAENSPSKDERATHSVTDAPAIKPSPSGTTDVKAEASSAPNFFMVEEPQKRKITPGSKVLLTFDFTGASTGDDGKLNTGHSPVCINVTEENLLTLQDLVQRTGLASRSPSELSKILIGHSNVRQINGRSVAVMHKDEFGECIREIVPSEAARTFSRSEMENFSIYFTNFFACFEDSRAELGKNMIDAKEFAVGFSLLCAGNKSAKLASGFELLDKKGLGCLTEEQLADYIRSYLTMLVGISLLSKHPEKHESLSDKRKKELLDAISNGSRWTLRHFLKDSSKKGEGKITFEAFARWYTDGGFDIAPWLELLDLRKLLSLIPGQEAPPHSRGPASLYRSHGGSFTSPRRRKAPSGYPPIPPNEILFTFPLAKERSLVVLREDATYVRSVVERLGLLSLSPDEVWSDLYDRMKKRPPPPAKPWSRSHHRSSGKGKIIDVDQDAFVQCMEELMQAKSTNPKLTPSKTGGPTVRETLQNFFQSFDLDQVDRVKLNQLMGGLSLLCGGKKSTKLAFSFGLFDGRKETKTNAKNPSLNVEDLFVFLRSFLIVMFSCCRQSLDLSAEDVGRYISDTAHMVAEDVMRYQWHIRSKDRVDFDEFGEWYNEGGFETAPWLELLDLNKWVLVENIETVEHDRQLVHPGEGLAMKMSSESDSHYCPPPPPEDAVDPSFFGDDDNAIMPMDSMDEMDLMLMQQPSHDKENGVAFSLSPGPHDARGASSNALKFHLVSQEDHGGYMVSVSQTRVRHLRNILVDSGLYAVDSEAACNKILRKASKVKSKTQGVRLVLEKQDFDSAMRSIFAGMTAKGEMSAETQRTLSDLLAFIFRSFDHDRSGKVDATELACGFTVLCDGKKSDKLEYAFELMDMNRNGKLDRSRVCSYLQSFLTVLLCVTTSSHLRSNSLEDSILYMNGRPCSGDHVTMERAADSGSDWAATQAFKGCYSGRKEENYLNFDDFAEWYTRKGFSCIPWLELLDLRKWVITE